MRTWSIETEGYDEAMLIIDGRGIGWLPKEHAQFIVDALNAAERAKEPRTRVLGVSGPVPDPDSPTGWGWGPVEPIEDESVAGKPYGLYAYDPVTRRYGRIG